MSTRPSRHSVDSGLRPPTIPPTIPLHLPPTPTSGQDGIPQTGALSPGEPPWVGPVPHPRPPGQGSPLWLGVSPQMPPTCWQVPGTIGPSLPGLPSAQPFIAD